MVPKGPLPKVELDERLTDLFHSRRKRAESPVKHAIITDALTNVPQDMAWLNQFTAALPGAIPDEPEIGKSYFEVESKFRVPRRDVRPFCIGADIKPVISLWKKSRKLLARDCQKQRKAALRKSIRR